MCIIVYICVCSGGMFPRSKKGRSKMGFAIFFVTDEYGTQIKSEHLGQVNEFSSFRAAERAARDYSKENPTCIYSVDVAINRCSFRNGKIYKEV